MSTDKPRSVKVPCFCLAVSAGRLRAVSRVYDDELRRSGLRTTQYSVLRLLRDTGEVRQRDLGAVSVHDETTLTQISVLSSTRVGWPSGREKTAARNRLRITAGGVQR